MKSAYLEALVKAREWQKKEQESHLNSSEIERMQGFLEKDEPETENQNSTPEYKPNND
jgi:NADH:ubiquinone oxidoreductase subunit